MPAPPVGIGPSGSAPLGPGAPQAGFSAGLAPRFNPVTRDAVLLPSGLLQGDHPIDAWVDLQMSIPRGSMPCAPDVGNRIRAIGYVTDRLDAEVNDAVREALAPRIRTGDISIRSIRVERGRSGAFAVAIEYVNLRTQLPRSITKPFA